MYNIFFTKAIIELVKVNAFIKKKGTESQTTIQGLSAVTVN